MREREELKMAPRPSVSDQRMSKAFVEPQRVEVEVPGEEHIPYFALSQFR